MNATAKLHALGQSLWLDNITRDLLNDGTLKGYIDALSVTGLTSNPTIFDHAVGKSSTYDGAIRDKLATAKSTEDLGLGEKTASAGKGARVETASATRRMPSAAISSRSSSVTRGAAAGSEKLMVPSCTQCAPAIKNSSASSPERMPPMPQIGKPGSACAT
jgi:hypothetical protein